MNGKDIEIFPPNLEGKGSIQRINSPVHGPFQWNAEADVTFRLVSLKTRPYFPRDRRPIAMRKEGGGISRQCLSFGSIGKQRVSKHSLQHSPRSQCTILCCG